MGKSHFISIFSLILILSLMGGICLAEDTKGSHLFLQGGTSTLTDTGNGNMILEIQDMIPFFSIEYGGMTLLTPIDMVIEYPLPMEGAVVCMGKDTLTNSMIHVTNLSVDTEKNTLTLQLKPSEFYEGNLRNALSGEVVTLNEQITSSALNTGIHLEAAVTSPENIARLPIIPRTRPCLIPLEEGQSCPEWARPPA